MFDFLSLYKTIAKDLVTQYLKLQSENKEFDKHTLAKMTWERYLRNHAEKIKAHDSNRKKVDLHNQIENIEELIEKNSLSIIGVYNAVITVEFDLLSTPDKQYGKMMDYFIKYAEKNGIKFDISDYEY